MKYGKKKMTGGGRLYDYMRKGGKLKMVENEKGEMVPFYAADGEGKMEMGGKMRGYKMMQEGGETDPPKATKKDVMRQLREIRRERDEMLSGQLIKGETLFADANPELRGLTNFGDESKTSAKIKNFYGKKEEFLLKKAEELDPVGFDREEFFRMLGADDESIEGGGVE